jgi:hypothetical protein
VAGDPNARRHSGEVCAVTPRKLLIAGAGCSLMLIGAAVSSQQAHAGFLGDTLTGTWNYPAISDI